MKVSQIAEALRSREIACVTLCHLRYGGKTLQISPDLSRWWPLHLLAWLSAKWSCVI
jgi:hypothetical protein